MTARKTAPETIVVEGRTYALVSESAPVKAKAASPFAPTATKKGERMHDTRAYNLANKVARKHCPACAKGFVYEKATCPGCGASL